MQTGTKTILICEDDDNLRQLIRVVIGDGYRVLEAGDGDEALALAREDHPDLIILDLLMPVTDGFAVLEWMRSRDLPSSPVVLVVTGADRSLVESVDPTMIHGVIRKPFDPEELAAVVATCAEIKCRSAFETMAVAMMASGALLTLLK